MFCIQILNTHMPNTTQSLFKLSDDVIIQSLLLVDIKDIGKFMQTSTHAEELGNQTFSMLWYNDLGCNHSPYILRCLENFRQNWFPRMTRLPMNHTWMIVGISTCSQCKAVSFDTACHNANIVTINSTNLLMCEPCTRASMCEGLYIWDGIKT